jgi:hypothetical protein
LENLPISDPTLAGITSYFGWPSSAGKRDKSSKTPIRLKGSLVLP